MKNIFSIFLLTSFLLVSCNKKDSGGSSEESTPATETPVLTPIEPTPPPVVTPPEEPTPPPPVVVIPDPGPVSDLPADALSFSTNILKLNFTNTQEEKYDKAIEMVKLVVATEEFRNKVLNYTYKGVKQFADNKGRSNAEIYQTILEAAETLQPSKNNRMDLEVELYYSNNSTVGYTYPSSKRIWVNSKFFNQYAANSVAGNLFHEWLHKLGYTHDSAVTAKRPYTVPYAIGYIMRDIAKKFL